jgi:hypothetical protein
MPTRDSAVPSLSSAKFSGFKKFRQMTFNRSFVCNHAGPGIGCNFPEAIVMTVLFWGAAIFSLYFLIMAIRASKSRCFLRDQTVLFWLSISLWQLYHGTLTLIPFHWDLTSYIIAYDAMNHILMFTSMCFVILNLFELLFNYRNPGTNGIAFFYAFFILFLVTFIILGISLTFVDRTNTPERALSLWGACTDLVLAIFFALPALSLLEAVTYPIVQPEDACCVNFCKVGIAMYVLLFIGRMIWNGTFFFGANSASDWLLSQVDEDGIPNGKRRGIWFVWVLLFDYGTSVLGMISVFLFKTHGMMFNENPYYTRND